MTFVFHQLLKEKGSADGESFSDPEFFEHHSYYVKKSKKCCACMRREIRTMKRGRGNHPLSWTSIIQGTEVSQGTKGSAFASARVSKTNLSGLSPFDQNYSAADVWHQSSANMPRADTRVILRSNSVQIRLHDFNCNYCNDVQQGGETVWPINP